MPTLQMPAGDPHPRAEAPPVRHVPDPQDEHAAELHAGVEAGLDHGRFPRAAGSGECRQQFLKFGFF